MDGFIKNKKIKIKKLVPNGPLFFNVNLVVRVEKYYFKCYTRQL